MKKLNIYIIIGLLFTAFACEETQDEVMIFEGGAISHFTSTSGALNAKKSTDTYSIEVGTTTSAAATIQLSVNTTLSTAIEGVHFEAFPASVSIGQGEFVTSFTIVPLPESGMDVGETVTLVVDISNPTENVGFDQSFTLNVTRICPPYPGVWTIVMHDSYGDGWQTNDSNGGNGIQVTLDDGTVLEVGLCNPYVASPFECTPNDGFEGTGTITIPEGTGTASWYFPGDAWGEISFEIFAPDGPQVWTSPLAAGAGALGIVHCAP